MGGVTVVLLSLEGYDMLLLCYCQRRDRCYYCVIVREGIGVIIVLLSGGIGVIRLLSLDRCYYCVIVTGGIGVITVLLSLEG